MYNQIQIKISGVCASGKSTIAAAIETALKDLGLNVTNSDYDVVLGCLNPDTHADRVEALKTRDLHVNITCENVRKEPYCCNDSCVQTTNTYMNYDL